ncbi:MAG: phosphate-binding protein, partial [Spirochaetia bacterium]|nr:phosphate-binding protein [Spirochaetia bacterium]
SQASVDAGTYSLVRPLFLYFDAGIIRSKSQVAAFLTYYLTYVNDLITRVGYFPAPRTDLRKSKTLLTEAMKGLF